MGLYYRDLRFFFSLIVKELGFWVRSLRKRIAVKRSMPGMREQSFSISRNFLSRSDCVRLQRKIDGIIESGSANIWSDSQGADQRIYFAEQLDEDLKELFENSLVRSCLADYTSYKEPVGMLLAARITNKPNNRGSGGGWHRDSALLHQFKAICYLNDVEEDGGPFEIVSGSHKLRSMMRDWFDRVYPIGAYRYSEPELERVLENDNNHLVPVLSSAGNLIFADTRAIHRGRPIKKGVRYALFWYFWEKEIPEHFTSLKQHLS